MLDRDTQYRPISYHCSFVTKRATTYPIGINPRPASASRALLRLSPCYRIYRSSPQGRPSGTSDSPDLTGGEYKARERIHRDVLIHDY